MVRISSGAGSGTGFIFETTDSGGAYILTNYHVIEAASRLEVSVNESTNLQPTVLGYNAYRDLAVLEICCGTFEALSLQGSPNVKPGEEVIAIGYPLGIAGGPTVSRGIVSNYRYDESYQAWLIQTDAPINPGNSGRPLLLSNGKVVGINTFIIREDQGVSVEGVGFAISGQSILASLDELKQGIIVDIPTPTPDPPQDAWQTYTDLTFGYAIDVPGDWTVDDSEGGRVNFVSPDEIAAVHIFTYESSTASVEQWMIETIEGLREYNKTLFEITRQSIEENEDGTGVAAIVYRGRTSPEYCATLRSHIFVVTPIQSLIFESRFCEEFGEKYATVVARIIKSISPG